jgi:hypothetical protein
VTGPDRAPALPERARFTLAHCTGPMRFRGSVVRSSSDPEMSLTTTCRFVCDDCGATLELHLTEPATTT